MDNICINRENILEIERVRERERGGREGEIIKCLLIEKRLKECCYFLVCWKFICLGFFWGYKVYIFFFKIWSVIVILRVNELGFFNVLKFL